MVADRGETPCLFPIRRCRPANAHPSERYDDAKLVASGFTDGGKEDSHCIPKRHGVSSGRQKWWSLFVLSILCCQHARTVAVCTAPHEDRAAAHLCGALNSLQRYNSAARAGRDRCIPHCVRNICVLNSSESIRIGIPVPGCTCLLPSSLALQMRGAMTYVSRGYASRVVPFVIRLQ
jgi:hypothetical protein